MKKEKGIAYCGLACCVCSNNETCAGCRNDGCTNKEWCKNFVCCKERELNGCWECSDFPCRDSMLDKLKIRAFSRFVAEYGECALMKRLEENERSGIIYHYKGQITGDYDKPSTEEDIIKMLLCGNRAQYVYKCGDEMWG